MWMIIPLGFMLAVLGTLCQEMTLDAFKPLSPCTTGLRKKIDRFFINGTATESAILESSELCSVRIEILPKTGPQILVCFATVTTRDCQYPDRTENCYCSGINLATGVVNFVANLTAELVYSEGTVRAKWSDKSPDSIFSKNNVSFSKIHDLQEAQLNLTVYGVMGNLTLPGSCNFSLKLNISNHLRLCCFNTPTPCHPRISFGADVVSGRSCVSYPTSPLTSDGVTRDLVLSFSVCNQVENILGRNCKVTTTPDVFIPPTGLPDSMETPGTTESPGSMGTPGTAGSPATMGSPTTATTTTATTTTGTTITLITSTSNENPRPTTLPFLWTTDMMFKRGDKNVISTFGPGLLLAGLSFIGALAYVFWVSREASVDNQLFNNYPEAGDAVEEKDSDKYSEADHAFEEKDNDTLKQEDNSSKVSTSQV